MSVLEARGLRFDARSGTLLSFLISLIREGLVAEVYMCTLVLVNCLRGLSLSINSVVTLTDRPHITMDVKQKTVTTKLSVGKRPVSVDALVNLKTTSCQQLLYYDVVSAALWPTDDLPRKSVAHCYCKRHAKIMLYIQFADY